MRPHPQEAILLNVGHNQPNRVHVGRKHDLRPLPGLADNQIPHHIGAGGSVPVQVRGMGIAGTVTVSGLTEEEDHALAAEVMREYLEEQERRRV